MKQIIKKSNEKIDEKKKRWKKKERQKVKELKNIQTKIKELNKKADRMLSDK